MTRSSEIEHTELTQEEKDLAIWEAKFKKWNRARFKDYWDDQEKKKPKDERTKKLY